MNKEQMNNYSKGELKALVSLYGELPEGVPYPPLDVRDLQSHISKVEFIEHFEPDSDIDLYMWRVWCDEGILSTGFIPSEEAAEAMVETSLQIAEMASMATVMFVVEGIDPDDVAEEHRAEFEAIKSAFDASMETLMEDDDEEDDAWDREQLRGLIAERGKAWVLEQLDAED